MEPCVSCEENLRCALSDCVEHVAENWENLHLARIVGFGEVAHFWLSCPGLTSCQGGQKGGSNTRCKGLGGQYGGVHQEGVEVDIGVL